MVKNINYSIFFILILIFFRIIPHPPNFSPIIAFSIVSPIIFKDKYLAILITILSLFISDIILGFHAYQFIIYITIISISFFTPLKKRYLNLFFYAIAGSVWFFISTNFAVWLIWDYYPKSLEGLIYCYTMGIPFFKNTLLSTIIFTLLLTYSFKYLDFINININNFIKSYAKK